MLLVNFHPGVVLFSLMEEREKHTLRSTCATTAGPSTSSVIILCCTSGDNSSSIGAFLTSDILKK